MIGLDHAPGGTGLPFIFAGVDPDDWRDAHTARTMADFILDGNRGDGTGSCCGDGCSIKGARMPEGGRWVGARGNNNTGADGANILMHDGGGNSRQRSVDALPLFIPVMMDLDYEFVTVEEHYRRKNISPCIYNGERVNDWIRPAGTPGGCNHSPRCPSIW